MGAAAAASHGVATGFRRRHGRGWNLRAAAVQTVAAGVPWRNKIQEQTLGNQGTEVGQGRAPWRSNSIISRAKQVLLSGFGSASSSSSLATNPLDCGMLRSHQSRLVNLELDVLLASRSRFRICIPCRVVHRPELRVDVGLESCAEAHCMPSR